MIKNVHGYAAATSLQQLRATLQLLDRVPALASTAARLSQVISELEEWIADQIMAGEADPTSEADRQD